MGKSSVLAIVTLLFVFSVSCNHLPAGPVYGNGLIVANVHYQDQGISGIKVLLVQSGDSTTTGPNGFATFSVAPGHYTVRAFGINRGGPAYKSIDFDVTALAGEIVFVDIFDCLPCV